MKCILTTMILGVFCSISFGQQIPSNYEHLKCFEGRIGEWVYDGPALETIPGTVTKGDAIVMRSSLKWTLNKNAIESTFTLGMMGSDRAYVSRGLAGWDAANKRIVGAELDSFAGYSLYHTVYDPKTSTWTIKSVEGANGNGAKKSVTIVYTLKSKDSIEFQLRDRKGSIGEGDSPKYLFKRVRK